MNCLFPKKHKKKRKRVLDESDENILKKIDKKWSSCDIDDGLFSKGCTVDGFLGLEEITDYNEDDISAIVDGHSSKKAKIADEATVISSHNHVDENKVQSSEEYTETGECVNACNVETSDNANQSGVKLNSSLSGSTKKLSKRERRKEARKLSFKQKLKEKRKKLKEAKKAQKADSVIPVEEMCNAIIKKAESFTDKNSLRKDMSEWLGLGVPGKVLKALSDSNFVTPTPIQRECLPHAIFHRQDIIGAAETGSGKTLAFGIPLIKNIMELKEKSSNLGGDLEGGGNDDGNNDGDEKRPLFALIVSPTRELALQINEHISTAAKYTDIKCVPIVGGLACPKQERLLSKCPEIVVGTPGRLHKLITDGEEHLNKFECLKYLVIDEADRMLEHGHFKELSDILEMIFRVRVKRQIFVFSATLTLPQYHKSLGSKGKTNKSEMQVLVDKMGLSSKAKVIDLTTKHVTATQLQQLRVLCTNEEKELYLAYFLNEHPGRTIVFVNSISCTRRLCVLFSLLGYNPLQLHSGKQQRQRLKYLDRFISSDNGLLIATDVAARGLDVPKVCNVVHYQLPSDPKVYIHRSGRTARANEKGLSFILEGPGDFSSLKKISHVLKLSKDIPSLQIDRKILEGIKARVTLAREIDKEEYKFRKENADNSWLKKTAESMDIETDIVETNNLTKREKSRLSAKRKQLQKLLATELYPTGFSGNYPTKSGSLILPSF